MTTPFFSVVIAVQNGFPYLPDALNSVLRQTFTDFEVIVVDDHSSDETLPYLRSLQDRRLVVLESAQRGQTPALNVGIRHAKADWIARMDGDDWCEPDRLEAQRKAIEAAAAPPALVSSDYTLCDEDLKPLAVVTLAPPNERLRRYLFEKNNPFCHPTVTFHRASAERLGLYDESIQNAQDYRLWRGLLEGGGWAHVEKPLLKYRVRRGSLSVLHQPQQTAERKAILSGATPETPLSSTGSPAAGRVEATYRYKLGFGAWVGGRRADVWCQLLSSIRAASGYRAKSLALLALSILPRSWRLALAGYGGVYR